MNYKSLSKLALIFTYVLIASLFALMLILPFGVQWYAEVKNRSSELATVVMLTCYPCSPFAIYALFSLKKLLSNIYKGDFFNTDNFKCLKGVAISCLIAGLGMIIAGFFYMPFYVGGGAAIFCALMTLVFKSILEATKPQEETKEDSI